MSLFEELIAKHIKRRDILLQEQPSQGNGKKTVVKPFITISREAGSGGKPIAKAVAKRLGFKLYDKKLIDMTSKKAKKTKALIETLDEKDRGFIEDLVQSLLNPDYVSEETYLKNLCQVILAVARKGNCVIIGRGGNFVANQYGGLHVRIAAPFLIRAGYTAQYEGYSIYEARERMKEFDRERKEFIKKSFGKDPSNANYYDLVINTTYFNIEQATDVIVEAFKKKFPDWKKYL
ncbi:MAG: cytidylate kinase-like family protein [Patescibacteria group bacterium]